MVIILTVILIILILIFCGEKGAKSIVSTAMNSILLLVAIYMIYRGLNPIGVTMGVCTLISCVTLFYPSPADVKSKVALGSVIIVLLILIPLVYYIASGANSEGFNSEQYEITDSNGYTRNIDMNMLALQISVLIIALIGTVIDIAVAITASTSEFKESNPNISLADLMVSSFSVSKAILNTSIHTIFYIYIAEYMTLLIQYVSDYSLVDLINSKSFCQEFISIGISGIGCCLIVPVATIMSVVFMSQKKKSLS